MGFEPAAIVLRTNNGRPGSARPSGKHCRPTISSHTQSPSRSNSVAQNLQWRKHRQERVQRYSHNSQIRERSSKRAGQVRGQDMRRASGNRGREKQLGRDAETFVHVCEVFLRIMDIAGLHENATHFPSISNSGTHLCNPDDKLIYFFFDTPTVFPRRPVVFVC